ASGCETRPKLFESGNCIATRNGAFGFSAVLVGIIGLLVVAPDKFLHGKGVPVTEGVVKSRLIDKIRQWAELGELQNIKACAAERRPRQALGYAGGGVGSWVSPVDSPLRLAVTAGLLRLARIVGRVEVGHSDRSDAAQLDYGVLVGPFVMMHALRKVQVTAGV